MTCGCPNATRLVEIGPGPTLVGMAQRTLALKYQKADQARNIKRDVLPPGPSLHQRKKGLCAWTTCIEGLG